MPLDIFQTLTNVLCPTIDAAQRCQDFIFRHQAETGDIQTLLFFLFFPTVFMILFVYILSSVIFKGSGAKNDGIRLLVAIAIYVFIIIQGWYSIILPLAEFWFIFIIVIVGLWLFVKKMIFHWGDKEGGGRGGGALPSLAADVMRREYRAHLDPGTKDLIAATQGLISSLGYLTTTIKAAHGNERARAQYRESFRITLNDINNNLITLQSQLSYPGHQREIVTKMREEVNKIVSTLPHDMQKAADGIWRRK